MPHNTPMEAATHDPRLVAVMARDRRADGAFVYAVRSTGVFCKPSCSSRRPRHDRIAFFRDAVAARRAGFRACLRCQPESSLPSEVQLAQQVCRYIEACEGQPTLAELGAHFGFSPHHLSRTFKAAIGLTPAEYGALRRLERFKVRVRNGEKIADALYGAGYGSSSRLYENGARLLGMTPKDYRNGGNGALIRYTIVDSQFGKILAAATERGVCAVSLGNDVAVLERNVRREFACATVVRDDQKLAPVVARIIGGIERGERLNGLAVDVAATAFRRAVWRALSAIPPGQTRTYGEIAASIGHPKSARAVARACAANKVALVIPCHRAVPKSGGVGGYRWGADRKRALLKRERDLRV
jgi:AraC family transcriptional regulator of adaptative response/methylated-DNA-[protein]-cysteine methyltransferase